MSCRFGSVVGLPIIKVPAGIVTITIPVGLVTGPPPVTVTEQVAVLFPSAVVTVIVAEPAATAVTVPFATVAFVESLDVHVTFLFVALDGVTVAVNVSDPPTASERLLLLRVTPVTETG